MDEATRRWVQRFVDGINHYQDTASELPHDFGVLGLEPEPWTLEDVFVMGRLAGTDVNWLVWAGPAPAARTGRLGRALGASDDGRNGVAIEFRG